MKKALLTLFFAIASRSYAVEFGDIPADYTLYSAGDPFAIALATNNAAVKMNINNGTSSNQTLRLPRVADRLSFSLGAAPALGAGEIAWDPDWLTFKAGLSNGVEGQFFQEHHIVAKNAWTNTIPNGWVVMHSGVVGNSGKYEVVPSISTPALDPTRVIGMTTEDIPVGALGRITARGNVNQIGSDGSLYGASGWQNNTPVYLCTTHVGWVTTNLIQAPYPRIYIGNIVRAHSSGAIYIRVQPGLRLADLDDVDGTSLTATGQFPVYDSVRGVFDFNRDVGEFAGTNSVAVHTNRTDNPHTVTLAQAAAAGGFAGTEDIGPLRVSASMFGLGAGVGSTGLNTTSVGNDAGVSSSGDYWSAIGYQSGQSAVGNNWSAIGFGTGLGAKGNDWIAIGLGCGNSAKGDSWGSIGYLSGVFSSWTNSFSFGGYAGGRARGINRLYVDVYDEDPIYSANGATNDMIFGDNGYLTLGRGAGAPGGKKGGMLRGVWGVDSLTNATLTGNANVSGDTLIGAQAITNTVVGMGAITNNHAGLFAIADYKVTMRETNPVASHPVMEWLNRYAEQVAYVRADGIFYGRAFATHDNSTLGLIDSVGNPGVSEIGVSLGAIGRIGWTSDRWWQATDTMLYRSSAGVVGIASGGVPSPTGKLLLRECVATGTNAAAVVSSQGPVLLGPTIGGRQAFTFSDGTNLFFVNVNYVTNSITTN